MYILKNALTNIKRNPVRNLLVGIVINVIIKTDKNVKVKS